MPQWDEDFPDAQACREAAVEGCAWCLMPKSVDKVGQSDLLYKIHSDPFSRTKAAPSFDPDFSAERKRPPHLGGAAGEAVYYAAETKRRGKRENDELRGRYMSNVSDVLDVGLDLLRLFRDYFWKPQEIRKTLAKDTVKKRLIKIGGFVALFLILPLLNTTGSISFGSHSYSIESDFWKGFLFELVVLLDVAFFAAFCAGIHWLLNLVLKERTRFAEIFRFAVYNIGVLLTLFLFSMYAVSILMHFEVLPKEAASRVLGTWLSAVGIYALIVHIINFPPHRSALWAMFVVFVPFLFAFWDL